MLGNSCCSCVKSKKKKKIMRVCLSDRADSDFESSENDYNYINIIEKVFCVYMKWYRSTYGVFIMTWIWVNLSFIFYQYIIYLYNVHVCFVTSYPNM